MADYHEEMKHFNAMIEDIFSYYYKRKERRLSAVTYYNNWSGQTRYPPLDDEMSDTALEYFTTLCGLDDWVLDVIKNL